MSLYEYLVLAALVVVQGPVLVSAAQKRALLDIAAFDPQNGDPVAYWRPTPVLRVEPTMILEPVEFTPRSTGPWPFELQSSFFRLPASPAYRAPAPIYLVYYMLNQMSSMMTSLMQRTTSTMTVPVTVTYSFSTTLNFPSQSSNAVTIEPLKTIEIGSPDYA